MTTAGKALVGGVGPGTNLVVNSLTVNTNLVVNSLTVKVGTNTATGATPSSPVVTSGIAFTPAATADSTVYFQLAAAVAGSYVLTMGPTTGAENTIGNAVAVAIGGPPLITLRVPAGWKVILTLTTVTLVQTRVITS